MILRSHFSTSGGKLVAYSFVVCVISMWCLRVWVCGFGVCLSILADYRFGSCASGGVCGVYKIFKVIRIYKFFLFHQLAPAHTNTSSTVFSLLNSS